MSNKNSYSTQILGGINAMLKNIVKETVVLHKFCEVSHAILKNIFNVHLYISNLKINMQADCNLS